MGWKNPEGVMVVIIAAGACLLLERADWAGFWQSVTGSLEPGEAPEDAAARELFEETGFSSRHGVLRNAHYTEFYDIFPRFRYRYAPNVSRGSLHVFWYEMTEQFLPSLAPNEHLRYVWLPLKEAQAKVFSSQNRAAIERWLTLEEKV